VGNGISQLRPVQWDPPAEAARGRHAVRSPAKNRAEKFVQRRNQIPADAFDQVGLGTRWERRCLPKLLKTRDFHGAAIRGRPNSS